MGNTSNDFDKIVFNAFETDDLLLDNDIDPDANLFNESKFQKLDSPYYTLDELILFSKDLKQNNFSIFHLNIRSLNSNFEKAN